MTALRKPHGHRLCDRYVSSRFWMEQRLRAFRVGLRCSLLLFNLSVVVHGNPHKRDWVAKEADGADLVMVDSTGQSDEYPVFHHSSDIHCQCTCFAQQKEYGAVERCTESEQLKRRRTRKKKQTLWKNENEQRASNARWGVPQEIDESIQINRWVIQCWEVPQSAPIKGFFLIGYVTQGYPQHY